MFPISSIFYRYKTRKECREEEKLIIIQIAENVALHHSETKATNIVWGFGKTWTGPANSLTT